MSPLRKLIYAFWEWSAVAILILVVPAVMIYALVN